MAAQPDGQSAQPRRVSFWYILLLVAFSMGTSSVSVCSNQVIQLTARRFTTDMTLIGFIVSLQALNQLWATPYAAWKSDRIWTRIGRRKPVVLIMAPVLAVMVVLVPHATNLWMFIAFVFVLQMAEDAELAVIMPAISDSVPDKQRPLATAMWQFAVSISQFFTARYALKLMDPGEHVFRLPGAQTVLGRTVRFSIAGAHHWPYTISGIVVVATSIIFLIVMRERYVPPRPHEKFRPFSYGKDVFQSRELLLIYSIFLFQPLFYLVANVFLPTLAVTELHLTKGQYGHALSWAALTTMLTSIPFGYLFNHVSRRRALCIGACAYAMLPITFGLFFMHTQQDMAIFFVMQILAFNVFRVNFMPLVMEYTTPQNVGTVMGFTNAVNGVVRFTMYPLMGLLVGLSGNNCRLPLWGGYVGAIACVIALLMMRPPRND